MPHEGASILLYDAEVPSWHIKEVLSHHLLVSCHANVYTAQVLQPVQSFRIGHHITPACIKRLTSIPRAWPTIAARSN